MAEKDFPSERTCGTQRAHERLLREDPGYMAARAECESHAWAVETGRAAVLRTGITVIPVVVHVVYRTNVQNISEEQIRSQIEVLNRDFRATNPDRTSTPPVFQSLIADARIEFELATTDPDGNPTDGITRTSTNTNSFTDDDAVKSAASGGADPWPADRYLNLWVCPLSGGLLGYATFPGAPAAVDGVVIRHSAFGTTGTAAAPFDLGRTATHEIGHWLNLRHIWGDDGNGCNGDDFVADTPNQAGSNSGTPAFPHVTCSNGPNGDLFMNYMDYVDDAAMFMFTSGQVARMQAALDNDRPTIGTTIGTLKFRDDLPQTVKFRDDLGTVKFVDDGGPPTTLKFRDDPQTLKFNDDVGTVKFRDDGGTVKFVDDGGGGGTLKFPDDVKGPGLDKPPESDQPKGPADLPGQVFGPPAPSQAPAPFVLATPHHSMAWTQSFPGSREAAARSYEAQLAQYEQVLEQYAAADSAGQLQPAERDQADQLYADYVRLAGEYSQLAGGR